MTISAVLLRVIVEAVERAGASREETAHTLGFSDAARSIARSSGGRE